MAQYDLTTEDGILDWLRSSEYGEGKSVTSVERLPGGASGFVYRGTLQNAFRASVIVKHVENYAARAQHWKLDPSRMDFEYEALSYLSSPSMQSHKSIRTPEVLYYDRKDHVLIMEDVGKLPSLKEWLQPAVTNECVLHIGRVLGEFLAKVHTTTAKAADLKARFNGNVTAKYLSGALYFGGLPAAAERFGYKNDFLQEAARVGQQEVDESNDVLTLGDFWTGNVLVAPGSGKDIKLFVVDLELAKPGTAEFDVGQMTAEMYCLRMFRDPIRGCTLQLSFLEAYWEARAGEIDIAKAAIRVGAHLVVVMPRAWSTEGLPDGVSRVVRYGVELIQMGVEKDVQQLRDSIVGQLVA